MTYKLLLAAMVTLFVHSCSPEIEKVIVDSFPDGQTELERIYELKGEERILLKEVGYYPGGQKRIEGAYIDEKREGRWTYWFENGNKWSEAVYKDDIRHGLSTVWYENGKKYYEGNYSNGERTGKWNFWDEEGNLMKEIDYNE